MEDILAGNYEESLIVIHDSVHCIMEHLGSNFFIPHTIILVTKFTDFVTKN